MSSSSYFRTTKSGNYFGTLNGMHCTVFKGKYGQWSYFLDENRANVWFDNAGLAMDSACEKAFSRAAGYAASRPINIPQCLLFFGLTPPVRRSDLMSRYRELARKTHPDRGGSCEAFKKVQAAFESAVRIVGGF